jgi:hypothetical protein
MSRKGAITKDVLASIPDDKLKPIMSTMEGLKESVHFISDKFDTITRSYYRKENAADMYMQDVLQPRSVFFNSLYVSTSITSYNCISHLIL